MLLFSAVLASQIAITPPQPLSQDAIHQALRTEISHALSEGQQQIVQDIRAELRAVPLTLVLVPTPIRTVHDGAVAD